MYTLIFVFKMLQFDCVIYKKTCFNLYLDRGVFYSDTGHSFANVLFHGNEMDLFSVEIMVFILFGSLTGDYLMAMLFVSALNRVSVLIEAIIKTNILKPPLNTLYMFFFILFLI